MVCHNAAEQSWCLGETQPRASQSFTLHVTSSTHQHTLHRSTMHCLKTSYTYDHMCKAYHLWPSLTCMQCAVCASHIHMVKSSDPASTTSPLGCQHSHSRPPPGPSRVLTDAPLLLFHTRAVPSMLALASKLPELLNSTATTESVWPGSW